MEALTFYHQARQALAQAALVDEVKDVRDKAEAIRLYQRQAGEGLELQNWCAEIKLRAERRLGELLRENPDYGRGKKSVTVTDLGINQSQAKRWQRIARLDHGAFERYIAETKAAGQELTSAGVAREAHRREPRKLMTPPLEPPARDPVDAQGRTPYVHWINSLRQIAALLEQVNHLGGFAAIIKRLTPAEVEEVIWQVNRLHQQVQALAGDVNRVGPVIKITATPV